MIHIFPVSDPCNGGHWLWIAGVVISSALFGYVLGTQLTKKRSRVNKKIKISTDKVTI